jgi:hypothetical protein
MATIRLGRYTSEAEDLPDVCMRCGAPTTLRVKKKFNWFPRWLYFLLLFGLVSLLALLPYMILWRVLNKQQTVSAPLCAAHRRHWFWRNLTVYLGLLGWLGLLVVAFVVSENARWGQIEPIGTVWVVFALSLLAWAVVTPWLQLTAIRATKITDRSITLAGVAEEFVRAYEEELPDPDRLDRAARERWGKGGRPGRQKDRFEGRDKPEERGTPPDTYREG